MEQERAILVGITTTRDPQRGGLLRIALEANPPSLLPIEATMMSTHFVTTQVFNALIQYDESLNLMPDLAESWTVSSNGLAWTFKLSEGVRWHDGREFTSADVKFTFEEGVKKIASHRSIYDQLETVDTPDAHRAILRLNRPCAFLHRYLGTMHAAIIPKHLYSSTDIIRNPFNERPVGTGPFKFRHWIPGREILLVRNEDYFKIGLPYLDGIIWKVMPEAGDTVSSLERGEIDCMPKNVPTSVLPRLQRTQGISVALFYYAATPIMGVQINLRNHFLREIRVREALSHAVNKQKMLEVAYSNFAIEATGPIPNTPDVQWTFTPNVSEYPFDLDRSNQLLDDSDHPRDSDGIRFRLRLMAQKGYLEQEKIAEIMREDFQKIGIETSLEFVDPVTRYRKAFRDFDFDLVVTPIHSGPDPHGLSISFHSKNIGKAHGNAGGYHNSKIDELFEQEAVTLDVERRRTTFFEIQEILTREIPAFWLVAPITAYATSETFVGLPAGRWVSRDSFERVYSRGKGGL